MSEPLGEPERERQELENAVTPHTTRVVSCGEGMGCQKASEAAAFCFHACDAQKRCKEVCAAEGRSLERVKKGMAKRDREERPARQLKTCALKVVAAICAGDTLGHTQARVVERVWQSHNVTQVVARRKTGHASQQEVALRPPPTRR